MNRMKWISPKIQNNTLLYKHYVQNQIVCKVIHQVRICIILSILFINTPLHCLAVVLYAFYLPAHIKICFDFASGKSNNFSFEYIPEL